ncbi:hypothetical protein B0A48_08027 [Cryoendolithus antarcticus]|uniref:Uncharacterized protein n=1 Tax=Cryoendolithus antarcticus TaxID=1507870 RepID=A0A1V8T1B0_9PEZI|nr:hypothetical protein B0A48_08027 [Cryoendolithus antarcticus]
MMVHQFWSGWALWEKLCFVLGLAIGVTLFVGGAKLAHNHYRLRKYSKVAERERQEQARHHEMLQRQQVPGQARNDEVPFGIRALESGVEIDGVWISRPNTPNSASKDRSPKGSMWTDSTRKSADVDLERQGGPSNRVSAERPRSKGSIATQNRISHISERTPSAERRRSSGWHRRDSSPSIAPSPTEVPPTFATLTAPHQMPAVLNMPAPVLEKPAKSRHPPLSLNKYSGNPSLYRKSVTVNALEGIEAIHRASTSLHRNPSLQEGSPDSLTHSSSNSSDGGLISSAAPRLFTKAEPRPAPRKRDHSADFIMLDTRRTSQAAETGQLTPSTRRAAKSMDWQAFPADNVTEGNNYFTTKSSKNHSPTRLPSNHGDAPRSPGIEALPAAARRSSMPEGVPSFAQFVQTAPPAHTRPTSSKGAESRDSSRPPQPTVETLRAYANLMSTSPPTVAGAEHSPVHPPAESASRPPRQSFEKPSRAEVVRGAGSGFEILAPGSLKPAMPVDEVDDKQRGRAPPVSMQNFGAPRHRSRSTSVGLSGGRKLQKKRRGSAASRSS